MGDFGHDLWSISRNHILKYLNESWKDPSGISSVSVFPYLIRRPHSRWARLCRVARQSWAWCRPTFWLWMSRNCHRLPSRRLLLLQLQTTAAVCPFPLANILSVTSVWLNERATRRMFLNDWIAFRFDVVIAMGRRAGTYTTKCRRPHESWLKTALSSSWRVYLYSSMVSYSWDRKI